MMVTRNPEEQRRQRDRRAYITGQVLEPCQNNMVSYLLAAGVDLDIETQERWVDAIWEGLRDSLDPQRDPRQALEIAAEAIIMLLEPGAVKMADRIRAAMP